MITYKNEELSLHFEEFIEKAKKGDYDLTLFYKSYKGFLQKLNFTTSKFARENLTQRERFTLVLSLEQMKQWERNINKNVEITKQGKNELKTIAIKLNDLIAKKDIFLSKQKESDNKSMKQIRRF